MKLVWKLLRSHISTSQLLGFSFAALFGMLIVLFAVQFYRDISPVFSDNRSFIKNDYFIVNKKVSTLATLTGRNNAFSEKEIQDIRAQSFVRSVGAFQSSDFTVSAGIGMKAAGIHLSTEMFFESVPDEFVDISLSDWHFDEWRSTIPVVIPRNYLNLYNFGFAQARNLPKLSEGVMEMIQFDIHLHGNGKSGTYKGNIVGFSNRLNTILVPEEFMNWANKEYASGKNTRPSRLILEVKNPADKSIAHYFKEKGYETEDNKLDAGKTTYFMNLVIGIVLLVGVLITILSFYILMLSVYLLLQKNNRKLKNLLLIGYSPARVAFPYQLLTVVLNGVVLIVAIVLLLWGRALYTPFVVDLFPGMASGGVGVALLVGIGVWVVSSAVNVVIIRRKVRGEF